MDKPLLLMVSCKTLSSKDTKREVNLPLTTGDILHDKQITLKDDYKNIGAKQIRILNDIIEKTKCKIIFIDDIDHEDYLKVILKDRGFKHQSKIIEIKKGEDTNNNYFNIYNCLFNLTILSNKKLSNIKHNNIIVKSNSGLTLNEGIKIISLMTRLTYMWEKTRSLINDKITYNFFDNEYKRCWDF